MRKYLKTDFYRLFTSNSFKLAICGVAFVYLTDCIELRNGKDIYQILYYIKFYSMLILIFAFGTVAFANVFVEDAEQKYWYLSIQRGNLNSYIWSKIIVCFWGSVIAIVGGIFLFVLIARFKIPFLLETNSLLVYEVERDCFGLFLNEDLILLYIFFYAVRMGFLSGILSVFSMLLSLYVRNRMFAVCIPVVGFYFWGNYFHRIFGENDYLSFNAIYLGSGNFFSNPVLNFLYALCFAGFFVMIIGLLIQSKVKKEIWGESK